MTNSRILLPLYSAFLFDRPVELVLDVEAAGKVIPSSHGCVDLAYWFPMSKVIELKSKSCFFQYQPSHSSYSYTFIMGFNFSRNISIISIIRSISNPLRQLCMRLNQQPELASSKETRGTRLMAMSSRIQNIIIRCRVKPSRKSLPTWPWEFLRSV